QVRRADPPEDVAGRMHLVEAVAHYWLGRYEDADVRARSARALLIPGTGAWYGALGYAAMASGSLGRAERLLEILEDLRQYPRDPRRLHFYATALCRLSVFMLRSGMIDRGRELIAEAEDIVIADEDAGVFTRAWLEVSRAELAKYSG